MDRQQIEELFPFYALDALNDDEKELVEAYLHEHPEARQEVEELKRAASSLPYGVTPVEPSPRSKELLIKRVAADQRPSRVAREQPAPSRGLGWENFLRVFSLGAAALAILWAIILNAQVASLRNQIAALNQALAVQSNAIQQINANLPQVPASGAITVSLKGTEVQPQAQGQLIADPDSQSAVLVITNLTPLEPGRTYQVWLIQGDAPQSAGLLQVDENGQGVLVVTSAAEIGSFDALGISIEPDEGSLQPTGDIVVLSNLQ
jgi:anti-sigma-K factor RskA